MFSNFFKKLCSNFVCYILCQHNNLQYKNRGKQEISTNKIRSQQCFLLLILNKQASRCIALQNKMERCSNIFYRVAEKMHKWGSTLSPAKQHNASNTHLFLNHNPIIDYLLLADNHIKHYHYLQFKSRFRVDSESLNQQ